MSFGSRVLAFGHCQGSLGFAEFDASHGWQPGRSEASSDSSVSPDSARLDLLLVQPYGCLLFTGGHAD